MKLRGLFLEQMLLNCTNGKMCGGSEGLHQKFSVTNWKRERVPDNLRHPHLSLNREDRWGTTDDFTSSFLHFPLFSTALWDLENSRPFHSLMMSSLLFLSLPCLLPPFTVPCKMVLA